VFLLLAMLAVAGCSGPAAPDPRMVSEWMHLLFGAIRVERVSPPVASRIYAYASAAMYSGLAATSSDMPGLNGRLKDFPQLPAAEGRGYDRTIVAVAAERTTLDSLLHDALPTTKAAFAQLGDSLVSARGASEATRDRSVDLGRRIGLAIVAWAHGDGFDSTRGKPYVPPKGPGLWVNDSPANWYASNSISAVSQQITFDNPSNKISASNTSDRTLILDRPKTSTTLPALNIAGVTEPYWGHLRTFALTTWDECPAGYPYPYSTTPGSPMYEDAKKVYDIHQALTPEQREIALFWADNPAETATPAGHWLAIAAELIDEQHLDAEDGSKVMLLTSLSVADGFIAVWGYKFTHNLLRPRTYIRAVIDPNWEPAIPTPPFPEYMAGHSAVSAAAGAALTATLGNIPLDDSTHVNIGHPVRHFGSILQAADEAGMSREYGGIHYPSGVAVGKSVGQCVASKILSRLGPVVHMHGR
jgi:hypothetical protein